MTKSTRKPYKIHTFRVERGKAFLKKKHVDEASQCRTCNQWVRVTWCGECRNCREQVYEEVREAVKKQLDADDRTFLRRLLGI
jgi:hypothetical protein